MNSFESDREKGNESVEEDFSLYRRRIIGGENQWKRTQMEFKESYLRARELLIANREIGRFIENRKEANSVKEKAEYGLLNYQNAVKNLSLQIGESNKKEKAQNWDLEILKNPDESVSPVEKLDNFKYVEVMRELQFLKQELVKLKLDMASVLEEKSQVDKETESSISQFKFYSISAQELRKEIEKANDEQLLVELARIEANKEIQAIEAQREAEAIQFSSAVEKTRKGMKDIIQELDHAKELETKLAMTTSDVDFLQTELELFREMDKKIHKNGNLDLLKVSKKREYESDNLSLLQSITEELEAAKKELECVREEGFKLMESMDVIRSDLKRVTDEMTHLKNSEEKVNLTIQDLTRKLLRAKSKLESASLAEEKAKEIVSNLTITLQKLRTNAEEAKKERELLSEGTASIKAEIQKTEYEIDLEEETLQTALKDLEEVKKSESIALENLKTLTQKAMTFRASASNHNSSITISNFEYEYLNGRAEVAEEIANKKVMAAQAWIEALKASEKMILMKTKIALKEIKEKRVTEEKEREKLEKSLKGKKELEGELRCLKESEEQRETTNHQLALPKKYPKENGKERRHSSTGVRKKTRSPLKALKKRRKVMPKLVKFFSSKRTKVEAS